MGRKQTWTDERLAQLVPECKTLREVTIGLGLYYGNKNVGRVRDRIKALELDTSHFTGGLRLENPWVYGVEFNTTTKRYYLNLVDYVCVICGLSEWRGERLVLQVDHIDGDRKNNTLENLRLLCPNCHSQTPTWSKKKPKEM